MTKTKKDIAQHIFQQIKTNKIKPKLLVILEEFIFFLLVTLLIISAIFMFNVTLFSLHRAQLPLFPLISGSLFFVLTLLFFKHYDFSYKTPFSFLLAFLFLTILLTATLLSFSQINSRLYRHPFMKSLYHSPAMRLHHYRMQRYMK